ncbi:hypothetical protein DFH09DRAFT_1106581 [Mycena vulgaris]|nr:hypothetical protein DFH09DRAFT_1106581 [Mycena vulgaris]
MKGLITQLHNCTPVIGSKHTGTVQLDNGGTAELRNCSITQLQNCSITQVKSKELQNCSTAHMKFTTAYLQSAITWGISKLLNGASEGHTTENWVAAQLCNCSRAQLKSGKLQNCATAHMKFTTVYLQSAITWGINFTTSQLHSGATEVHTTRNWAAEQLQNCSMAQLKSGKLLNCSTGHMKFTTTCMESTNDEWMNCKTAELHSGNREHTSGNCAAAQLRNCSMVQLKSIQPGSGQLSNCRTAQ